MDTSVLSFSQTRPVCLFEAYIKLICNLPLHRIKDGNRVRILYILDFLRRQYMPFVRGEWK